MANISYLNKIRSIDTYGGSSFWANFGSDTPEQLLGKPIYESSSMISATATGTGTAAAAILFGDWDQFIIVDRVGVSLIYEPMVKGTGATPSGQAGWFGFWRVGAGVSTASAFRYMTVG
jgi:HK97 family phage major capsid protein